jgi:hypothetical protein
VAIAPTTPTSRHPLVPFLISTYWSPDIVSELPSSFQAQDALPSLRVYETSREFVKHCFWVCTMIRQLSSFGSLHRENYIYAHDLNDLGSTNFRDKTLFTAARPRHYQTAQ